MDDLVETWVASVVRERARALAELKAVLDGLREDEAVEYILPALERG